MSSYIDSNSRILYGIYPRGSTYNGVGQHPSSSDHPIHRKVGRSIHYTAPHNYTLSMGKTWDYPMPTNPHIQYGGMRNNDRPLPPRYQDCGAYAVGNDYKGGYTQSRNTYVGGRRKKRGKGIVQ